MCRLFIHYNRVKICCVFVYLSITTLKNTKWKAKQTGKSICETIFMKFHQWAWGQSRSESRHVSSTRVLWGARVTKWNASALRCRTTHPIRSSYPFSRSGSHGNCAACVHENKWPVILQNAESCYTLIWDAILHWSNVRRWLSWAK